MPSFPVICGVCSKNSVYEVCHLLVALVEIRSNACVRNAGKFVQLKIPVINDHYEEHCFKWFYTKLKEKTNAGD
jgi:hypothetical protein